MASPLECFVLRQGERSQVGTAVAEAILRLGDAGYLTLFHGKSKGVILSRTNREVGIKDAAWIKTLLDALFGELNDHGKAIQLGGPKKATKPIAAQLVRSAQKSVRRDRLVHWLRPRLALMWMRTFALVTWFALLGVLGLQSNWVGVMGVVVLGIGVWLGVFSVWLEPKWEQRLSLTAEGEAALAELQSLYASLKFTRRPAWWHGPWSATTQDDTLTTMAKALSQRRRFHWLRALQVDEPQATIAKAS